MNIPENIQPTENATSRYLNKIDPGGSAKVLCVGNPIGLLEWWEEKDGKRAPVRCHIKDGQKQAPKDPDAGVKLVWYLHVVDLSDKQGKVWGVPQKSIQKAIQGLAADDDFDLSTMPLKVAREGSGMDTRYTVTPCPAINVEEEAIAKAIATPVDLLALADGGDPFSSDDLPF